MGEDIYCDNAGEPIATQELKQPISIGGVEVANYCQLCAGKLKQVIEKQKVVVFNEKHKPAEPVEPEQPVVPGAEAPAQPEQPAEPAPIKIDEITPAPAEGVPAEPAQENPEQPGVDPNA